MKRRWTKEEEQYLADHYGEAEVEDIARHLDRTVAAVHGRAQKIGLRHSVFWNEKEVKFLQDNYGSIPAHEIAKKLRRDSASVKNKAFALGLKSDLNKVSNKKYSFSKELLHEKYVKEQKSTLQIAEELGCSDGTVRNLLSEYGIELRPKTVIEIGQKYGSLTVFNRDDFAGKWICWCTCGRKVKAFQHQLINGAKDCCRYCKESPNSGRISGMVWRKIKKGSEERGIPLEIDREYAWDLFVHQEGKCALSGVDLDFASTKHQAEHGGSTASLDRIDSSLGYIKGNVQWVHKFINIMKWKLPQEEFIYWCEKVVNNNT